MQQQRCMVSLCFSGVNQSTHLRVLQVTYIHLVSGLKHAFAFLYLPSGLAFRSYHPNTFACTESAMLCKYEKESNNASS